MKSIVYSLFIACGTVLCHAAPAAALDMDESGEGIVISMEEAREAEYEPTARDTHMEETYPPEAPLVYRESNTAVPEEARSWELPPEQPEVGKSRNLSPPLASDGEPDMEKRPRE